MKKKKLKFLDRILLLNLLPEQGNMTTIIIVKDIRGKIAITQEEIKKYKLVVEGDQISWSNKIGEMDFEFSFTELERNEIKLALEKMSKDEKLTAQHLDLCRIFEIK